MDFCFFSSVLIELGELGSDTLQKSWVMFRLHFFFLHCAFMQGFSACPSCSLLSVLRCVDITEHSQVPCDSPVLYSEPL